MSIRMIAAQATASASEIQAIASSQTDGHRPVPSFGRSAYGLRSSSDLPA
jgi:hypothetical protein